MTVQTAYTLEQFLADTRATIKSKAMPAGLAEIRDHLEKLLGNPGNKSSVHDHGPCWVVYGNYKNPTRMRRWRRVDDGGKPGYAEVELQKEFMNEPGMASAFAVGDIHSIEFGDDTFFIRVTGGDVEKKQTLKFDVEKKTVEVANRALGQR